MTEKRASIYPPSSIEEVVDQIVDLPPTAYASLKKEVRTARGFEAEKARCEALAPLIDLTPEVVAVLLSAMSFLYTRINANPAEISEIIRDLVEGFEGEEWNEDRKDLAVERLSEVLSASPEIDFSRKIRRLKSGFIRNAIGFASFVDARPDFTDNNSNVRGFVPIVQFRISTDADNGSERDLLFQIDEAGIQALKEAIEAAEKKIHTLRFGESLTADLYSLKK